MGGKTFFPVPPRFHAAIFAHLTQEGLALLVVYVKVVKSKCICEFLTLAQPRSQGTRWHVYMFFCQRAMPNKRKNEAIQSSYEAIVKYCEEPR